MSKSKGNALSPSDLVKVFGVDAYRYYFMSDVQFGNDGSISIERMVQVYNNELANTWGNLCSRVLNMTKKYFEGNVPAVSDSCKDELTNNPMSELVKDLYDRYDKCMERVDFTGAIKAVQEVAQAANTYVENEAPFRLAKDETKKDKLAVVMYNLLESVRIIALYLFPFMPSTSAEVYRRLGLSDTYKRADIESVSKWGMLEPGTATEVGEPLFPRLDLDAIALFEE